MRDLSEYCTIDHHAEYVNNKKSAFNLDVRRFRLKNPWLLNNFGEGDFLSYIEPVNGSVIYYGHRRDPESKKEICILLNMEGQPKQVMLSKLGIDLGDTKEWSVALSTPNITRKNIDEPIRLSATQGLIYERNYE
jgi:hypothetical protein